MLAARRKLPGPAGDHSVLTLANGAYTTHRDRWHDLSVQRQRHARLRPGLQRQPHHRRLQRGRPARLPDRFQRRIFDLAYNAQGHLSQLTDSNGQTETFGYDATGQFLTSYTGVFGTTTLQLRHRPDAAAEQRPGGDRLLRMHASVLQLRCPGAADRPHLRMAGAETSRSPTSTPAVTSRPTATATRPPFCSTVSGATARRIDPLGNVTHLQIRRQPEPDRGRRPARDQVHLHLRCQRQPHQRDGSPREHDHVHLRFQQQPDQLHGCEGQHYELRLQLPAMTSFDHLRQWHQAAIQL